MGEDTRARGPRRSYYNVQRDSASNANFSFNVFSDCFVATHHLLPIATRLLAPSGALVFIVGYYIPSRGQRQKKNSRFFFRQMFFFVFLKVKWGLFSCIFCLNDSFICKFDVLSFNGN